MLSFIHRILTSDHAARKRKRKASFEAECQQRLTTSEIEDLRQVIAEHNDYLDNITHNDDREQTMAEFLALTGQQQREQSSDSKRQRKDDRSPSAGMGHPGYGRLSTIQEKGEEEGQRESEKLLARSSSRDLMCDESPREGSVGDEKSAEGQGDSETIDVTMGLSSSSNATWRSEESNNEMVVDQDLWTWKGGNGMWR
ncbi:hypothetical protein LTS08_005968 [Lithohypha guttulata]|uniref:uncharacterized protein n=1 Tax=Lithohypha guttulata TaxID=1690604 RepID=UPI002DE131CC|nr:hypothetical protein LTR51_002482 [Lithohypha guttulata]KAK5099386.1 hypothetical protein LTS08_005968 [Lithohypha guttulata]